MSEFAPAALLLCAHAARMPTPVSIAEVTTRTTPVSVFTVTSAPRSAG